MRTLLPTLLFAAANLATAAPALLPDFEIFPAVRYQSVIDGGRGTAYTYRAFKVDRLRNAVWACTVTLYSYSNPGGQAPQIEAICNKQNLETPNVKGTQVALEFGVTDTSMQPGYWFIDAVNGAVTYCNVQISAIGAGKNCTNLKDYPEK